MLPEDPLSLARMCAGFLVVAFAVRAPMYIRVIHMQEFEKLPGKLYWPFLTALDRPSKRHDKR